MNLESLLAILGQFGRYQKTRLFLVCLFAIVSAWHALNMVFIGADQQHHCDLSTLNNSFLSNRTIEEVTSLFIPPGESCKAYSRNVTFGLLQLLPNVTLEQISAYNRTMEPCWDGVMFSKEKSTIASEFELVCERRIWKSTSKSVFFFGRLCGAVIFGQVSDRIGRRPTFCLTTVLLLIAGGVSAAAPNMYVFLPMYFLQGAASTGSYLVAFTLCTELVGPRYRVLTGFLIPMFYSVGYMSLAGLAYLLKDWRHLEIAITIPSFLFLSYWWFLPESIRWQLSRNRTRQAEQTVRKIARTNHVTLPADMLERLEESAVTEKQTKYYIYDLVRTWKMARISLNVWFNWLVNALVYYGLSLNTENLGGNPYLNFCVAGAVEIPAYIGCIFLLNKVGRRWPLIASMLVGGIACILSGCIPTEGNKGLSILTVVLAMVGKIGITASYGTIYLLGAEVFPTAIRNIGMGVSSMSARIGGILAPQILELRQVSPPLPLIVFGVLSVLAGGLAFFLPETLNKPLPQKLEDVAHTTQCACFGKPDESKTKTPDLSTETL